MQFLGFFADSAIAPGSMTQPWPELSQQPSPQPAQSRTTQSLPGVSLASTLDRTGSDGAVETGGVRVDRSKGRGSYADFLKVVVDKVLRNYFKGTLQI
jgi:hypothetical protein